MEDGAAKLKEPATVFSIVHYNGLFYPEFEPYFVHRYYNQLKKEWYIMNDDKTPCVLTFNMDYENPTITKGWNELKKIYMLHDDVEVKFAYYPPKVFIIQSFKKLNTQIEIPSFHSRSLDVEKTRYFDIVLTAENIKLPTLNLPPNFAQFLKDHLIDYLIVCGDRRNKETLTVLDPNDTTKTALGHESEEIKADVVPDFEEIRFTK